MSGELGVAPQTPQHSIAVKTRVFHLRGDGLLHYDSFCEMGMDYPLRKGYVYRYSEIFSLH